MTKGLQFDEALRESMEMAYRTPDIESVRAEVVKVLDVRSGEDVLDIGSGPGFLAKDLADCVGSEGSLCGVDVAETMVEAGRRLCAHQPWVEFRIGDAMSLPVPDASFDVVVSTQVYEYVLDLEGALSEFGRVLRPGGRGLILDTDWAAPYWSATEPTIRDRIIEAWTEHCAQAAVPMRLSNAIRSADLEIQRISVLPLLNTRFDESAFSYWITPIIASFVLGRNGVQQSDIDAWLSGLEDLERSGDYFFCINRYVFEVTR
jgi:ubiquinone/menaquinone biosynthesis C-methylase UbiE